MVPASQKCHQNVNRGPRYGPECVSRSGEKKLPFWKRTHILDSSHENDSSAHNTQHNLMFDPTTASYVKCTLLGQKKSCFDEKMSSYGWPYVALRARNLALCASFGTFKVITWANGVPKRSSWPTDSYFFYFELSLALRAGPMWP